MQKSEESDYDHIFVSEKTLPVSGTDENGTEYNNSMRYTDSLSPALEINTLPNSSPPIPPQESS